MAGFLRQRGDSWELRVYVGRDPLNGKKKSVSRTFKGSRREAERALAAMVAEADQGTLTKSAGTVGELLEAWFEQAKADFSPKTVLETRGIIDRYLLPALGRRRLRDLRTADIDRFNAALRAGGGRAHRALAPATVRRIHGVLRRALNQAVRWGWIQTNPAAMASPPKVPPTEITPPAPEDVAELFALATDTAPELAVFVVLAAATGARRSELVALRWGDIDLVHRTVSISRAVVGGTDGLVVKDTKTHAARVVSLDPTTASVLETHRETAQERAWLCGIVLSPEQYVFTSAADGSISWRPDSTTRSFRKLCRQAGIEGVRLHDLRHYVATRLLAAGVDVRTVAGRLGHRDAATTLNVYSHFLPEADRNAADELGRIFDAAARARDEIKDSPKEPPAQSA